MRRLGRWALFSVGPALLTASLLLSPSALVLDKLLSRLAMPVGLLWALGYAAVWLLCIRAKRRAALYALGMWLLFSAAGNDWLGRAMLQSLEAGFVPPAASLRFDAVMVLGGGTNVTPWGTPQLSHAGDRVRVGASLYLSGQAAALVCAGTSAAGIDQDHARDLAAETAELWAAMGVPRSAIFQVPGPHNTQTEIAALARLAAEQGWRRIGLVTSAWHLRRAMRLADQYGLQATPVPADFRGGMSPAGVLGVVPTGNGFYAVQIATKELLGSLVGR